MGMPRNYPFPDKPWIDDAPRDDCMYCRADYSRCPNICNWCHEKQPCPDTSHRAFGDIVRYKGEEWEVSSMHFYAEDGRRAASIIHRGDIEETERMVRQGKDVAGRKNRYQVVPLSDLIFVRRVRS